MSKTLQEIVSAAIAGAGHQKTAGVVASAASTVPVSLEEQLFAELDMLGVKEASDEEEEPPKNEKKPEDKDDGTKTKQAAAYGLTLARALTEAAHVVQKLAADPAVTESQHSHASTVSPKAQTPGGPAIAMQNGAKTTGPAGKLPHDGHEAPKSASDEQIAQDPQAALRLLNAKLAAFKVCQETGQAEAASQHKLAADTLRKKLAEAGKLQVSSGGEGSHVPDNAGMASLTKAQARDANTREAPKFFGAPVKRDNAVQAHVGRTDGLKLSSLASLLGKGDRVLQAVGGRALDSAARGAKSVAGAAENRLFNGPAAGKLKTKVLEGATVHGHNTASRLTAASGTEGGRRLAGAATLGGAAVGANKLLGGKKEASDEDDSRYGISDSSERRKHEAHGRTRGRSIGNVLGAMAGAAGHQAGHGKKTPARAALVAGLGSLAGGAVGKRAVGLAQRLSPLSDKEIKSKEN